MKVAIMYNMYFFLVVSQFLMQFGGKKFVQVCIITLPITVNIHLWEKKMKKEIVSTLLSFLTQYRLH